MPDTQVIINFAKVQKDWTCNDCPNEIKSGELAGYDNEARKWICYECAVFAAKQTGDPIPSAQTKRAPVTPRTRRVAGGAILPAHNDNSIDLPLFCEDLMNVLNKIVKQNEQLLALLSPEEQKTFQPPAEPSRLRIAPPPVESAPVSSEPHGFAFTYKDRGTLTDEEKEAEREHIRKVRSQFVSK